MHPILFSIGGLEIHSYGAVMALGIVVGILYAMRIGKDRHLDPYAISEVGLWTVIFGLLGARLAYVLQHLQRYLQDPISLINLRKGGIAIQGALVLGFSATAYTCKKRSIRVMDGLDVYIRPVLLGMALGRVGCFLQGCCYGSPCSESLPWGVIYPESMNIACVPRHPSQIYEGILDIVLMCFLARVFKRAKFYGQTFWTGIAGYGVVRFIAECFRECDSSPVYGLSLAQWASVLFVIVGLLGALGCFGHEEIQPIEGGKRPPAKGAKNK